MNEKSVDMGLNIDAVMAEIRSGHATASPLAPPGVRTHAADGATPVDPAVAQIRFNQSMMKSMETMAACVQELEARFDAMNQRIGLISMRQPQSDAKGMLGLDQQIGLKGAGVHLDISAESARDGAERASALKILRELVDRIEKRIDGAMEKSQSAALESSQRVDALLAELDQRIRKAVGKVEIAESEFADARDRLAKVETAVMELGAKAAATRAADGVMVESVRDRLAALEASAQLARSELSTKGAADVLALDQLRQRVAALELSIQAALSELGAKDMATRANEEAVAEQSRERLASLEASAEEIRDQLARTAHAMEKKSKILESSIQRVVEGLTAAGTRLDELAKNHDVK